jgi:hypothetical protein
MIIDIPAARQFSYGFPKAFFDYGSRGFRITGEKRNGGLVLERAAVPTIMRV